MRRKGIGMTEGRHRKPASDEARMPIPKDAAFFGCAPADSARCQSRPYLEPKEIHAVWFMGTP